MDYLFYAIAALIFLMCWIFLSGVWSMAAIKRVERFEYHADHFFKHASSLLACEAIKPSLVQRILFLSDAVAHKKSAREFFFMFAFSPTQQGAPASQFDRDVAGLPQDYFEDLLKSVLHALLAISYQNFIFGIPFRALIASMLYDRRHQKQLAGRVYSGTEKALKSSELVFHH
jgi:hypothetical protein